MNYCIFFSFNFIRFNIEFITLQGSNISPRKALFEDDVPYTKVEYISDTFVSWMVKCSISVLSISMVLYTHKFSLISFMLLPLRIQNPQDRGFRSHPKSRILAIIPFSGHIWILRGVTPFLKWFGDFGVLIGFSQILVKEPNPISEN